MREGGGGGAEKVSIAVVSSHGAICWGKLGAAVEKSSAAVTVASASEGKMAELSQGTSSRPRARQQASAVVWKKLPHLVQVGHEVLVERADQHVEGPLTLLGKRWCLQCGFFSIDYCKISEKTTSRTLERSPPHLWSILFLTFDQ